MNTYDKIEFYVLLATISVAALVSVLDFVGALGSLAWMTNRIPTLTLSLVALIATSLLLMSRRTHERFHELGSLLLERTPTIRYFSNDTELMEYVVKRITEADCVYDLTWLPPFVGRDVTRVKQDDYLKAIEERSRRITYREIMIFYTEGRLKKAKRLLERAGSGYELGYYEAMPEHAPTPLQFMIIDEEEVIFSKLAIRGKDYAAPLVGYYGDLWRNAKKIRVGESLDLDVLTRIERNLKNS